MKYQKFWFFILILPFFFSSFSCKQKQDNNQSVRLNRLLTNDSTKKQLHIPEISSLIVFLQQLDNADVKSMGVAIDGFISIMNKSEIDVCDSAYIHFQQFADSIEFNQNTTLEEDTADYNGIFSGGKIPKRITDFVFMLNENGFRIQLSDSFPIIIQDRKFIAEKFKSLISENLKTYLNYVDNEFRIGFAESDSIIISPFELVDRILWYDNFILNHPGFVFRGECENHLKAYTTYLVLGYGKTKFFQDENKFIISDYFRQSFEYLFNKNTDSITATKLSEVNNAIQLSSINKLIQARKNLSIKGIIYNIST